MLCPYAANRPASAVLKAVARRPYKREEPARRPSMALRTSRRYDSVQRLTITMPAKIRVMPSHWVRSMRSRRKSQERSTVTAP